MIDVAGDRYRFVFQSAGADKDEVEMPLTLHLGEVPRSFELGGPKGSLRGIFKILADGRLIVAFAKSDDGLSDDIKPTSFDSRRDGVFVVVLRR